MRSVVLGALVFAVALAIAAPATAQPVVSVGDATVAPVVVIGDVDVFEDVLEYVNIAGLWSRASLLVEEGPAAS